MCMNASSRLAELPRTSASVPSATIRPAAITPTCVHSSSTSAITWLEKMTVPPPAVYRVSTVRITLADTEKLLSRAHLEFGLDGNGQFWISDLHSTNGVTIERAGQAPQRCLPGYRVVIQPGDRVTFGGRILTISAR